MKRILIFKKIRYWFFEIFGVRHIDRTDEGYGNFSECRGWLFRDRFYENEDSVNAEMKRCKDCKWHIWVGRLETLICLRPSISDGHVVLGYGEKDGYNTCYDYARKFWKFWRPKWNAGDVFGVEKQKSFVPPFGSKGRLMASGSNYVPDVQTKG